MKDVVEEAKGFVDRLTQSIVAKAFRGELVPQAPDDEPASVLLERIRAERGRQGPKRNGRGEPKEYKDTKDTKKCIFRDFLCALCAAVLNDCRPLLNRNQLNLKYQCRIWSDMAARATLTVCKV